MYDMKRLNDMNCIHNKDINNISEFNIIHDILKSYKCTKNINIYYTPILHGCVNTLRGKATSVVFLILLYSICSSTVVIRMSITKIKTKKIML